MITERFSVEVETDESEIFEADVEVHYNCDLIYGADADGNRCEPRTFIEEIEIVYVCWFDPDGREIEVTNICDDLKEMIETKAKEQFNGC